MPLSFPEVSNIHQVGNISQMSISEIPSRNSSANIPGTYFNQFNNNNAIDNTEELWANTPRFRNPLAPTCEDVDYLLQDDNDGMLVDDMNNNQPVHITTNQLNEEHKPILDNNFSANLHYEGIFGPKITSIKQGYMDSESVGPKYNKSTCSTRVDNFLPGSHQQLTVSPNFVPYQAPMTTSNESFYDENEFMDILFDRVDELDPSCFPPLQSNCDGTIVNPSTVLSGATGESNSSTAFEFGDWGQQSKDEEFRVASPPPSSASAQQGNAGGTRVA